jgi:polar amino acid transport system ATP-binding protein
MRPRIMLFDEPTSALDPELKREVREAIMGLIDDGLTMLLVTHEMELVRGLGQRVILMDDGAIIGEGPPDLFPETSFLGGRHDGA